MSSKKSLLNQKYYFLRRSVISYYSRCVSINDKEQEKHFEIPCDFEEIMKFVSDLYYSYLKEEYKE